MISSMPKRSTSLALAALLVSSLSGCGKKSGGGGSDPVVPEAPEANIEPEVTKAPVAEPKKPKSDVALPSDLASLSFVETDIDLKGDFRIRKVETDAIGNFYVAIVSDEEIAEGQPAKPSFAILKFDGAGKELWRFPTLEHAAVSGSYLKGALADMHVSANGQVYLIGLSEKQVDIPVNGTITNEKSQQISATNTVAAVATNAPFNIGNIAFVSRIDGSGTTANSPKTIQHSRFAAPSAWRPLKITLDLESQVVIESTTTFDASNNIQQVQHVDANFKNVLHTTCFLTSRINAVSGDKGLVSVITAAPAANIAAMTAAAPALAFELADVADFQKQVREKIIAAPGKCFDLFRGKNMAETDPDHLIVKPVVLADGEQVVTKVKSLDDLVNGKMIFEEYDLVPKFLGGPDFGAANIFSTASMSIETGHSRLTAAGNDMIHFGLGSYDLTGTQGLVLGNARAIESKSWTVQMDSSSIRSPASLDILTAGSTVITAWTEVNLPGETNAGNRKLRLASLSLGDDPQSSLSNYEYSVPESTGHDSFSSVSIAASKAGPVVVFATAGTRDTASAPQQAAMKQATLLIGFTK